MMASLVSLKAANMRAKRCAPSSARFRSVMSREIVTMIQRPFICTACRFNSTTVSRPSLRRTVDSVRMPCAPAAIAAS